jgi:putative ABC transport system substrate-binding protein
MGQLNRRRLLLASSAVLATPVVARAQRSGKPRFLGILGFAEPESARTYLDWMFDELTKLGWTQGRNLEVKYLYARGDLTRMDPLAAELVALKPHVIYATSTAGVQALQRVTREIPVVFSGVVGDPVALGLVKSLRRPGGNITGFIGTTGEELAGKRLQLIKEMYPSLSRLALMFNPGNRDDVQVIADWQRYTSQMNVQITDVTLRNPSEVETAFAKIGRDRPDFLYIFGGPPMYVIRDQLASRAIAARIPTMSTNSQMVGAGMLFGYAPSTEYYARQGAGYLDRILRGANPAELPVQQPSRFELTVNLKTAKAIGVTVPQSILLRADRVIE